MTDQPHSGNRWEPPKDQPQGEPRTVELSAQPIDQTTDPTADLGKAPGYTQQPYASQTLPPTEPPTEPAVAPADRTPAFLDAPWKLGLAGVALVSLGGLLGFGLAHATSDDDGRLGGPGQFAGPGGGQGFPGGQGFQGPQGQGLQGGPQGFQGGPPTGQAPGSLGTPPESGSSTS